MTESVFPLIGAAFVVLAILPAAALVSKGALVALERHGPLHHLDLRYHVLVASSLVPLLWLISAGLHQVETGRSAVSCIFEHDVTSVCLESGFFAATLATLMFICAARALREIPLLRGTAVAGASALEARLAHLVASRPALASLYGRLVVTNAPSFCLGTSGLWHERVYVGLAFAAGLSDDALAAALGHEAEHVRARDPLRYLVLQLALAFNPAGAWLLRPHAARWLAAREAHCDREAVRRGSLPLPLADALVLAARPTTAKVALGTADTATLRLRIEMLCAFAERSPTACCQRGPSAFPVAFSLIGLALLLPHQVGDVALDLLHAGAERALAQLLQ